MKNYCIDCPDREACHQGASCELSKRFAAAAAVFQNKMKGNTQMSNTKITVTPADLVEAAKNDNLVTEVPEQKKAKGDDKPTAEKAKEVVEETAEAAKATVKDRLKTLVEKAKNNKQFFVGVAVGAAGTAAVMLSIAKEKAVEIVEEMVIADEPEPVVEDGTIDESGV